MLLGLFEDCRFPLRRLLTHDDYSPYFEGAS
jgi:hypothetical protein